MANNEDELRSEAHFRRFFENAVNIGGIVLRGNNHADGGRLRCGLRLRASDDEIGQCEPAERRNFREIAIAERIEARRFDGPRDLGKGADRFEARKIKEILNVIARKPVLIELEFSRAHHAGDPSRALPEAAVCVENDARAGQRTLRNKIEDTLHVAKIVEEIGNDDEVEFFGRQRFMHIAMKELEIRVAFARTLEHLFGKIDAHAARGFESRKQITLAATEFEHAHFRRHEMFIDLREPLLIIAADSLPIVERLRGEGFCGLVPIEFALPAIALSDGLLRFFLLRIMSIKYGCIHREITGGTLPKGVL